MAGEWTMFRLGDICSKIGSGSTPRGGSSVYQKRGVALIRSQNIYNDGFHHEGITFLTDEHAAELANVEVSEHDVLLNITGDSVARACQVDAAVLPARVNQHVAIIRPDPAVLCSRFLRYFLVSPAMQAEMLSLGGAGATRNALTKRMIESFSVLAPADIGEQRAIAQILGALDDKIELNRRMNETLESTARALFKSWFVDFDPVRTKAEGRDPGLSKDIASLFPDSLSSTALGEIPSGWRYRQLSDLVELTRGRTYQGSLKGQPGPVLLGLASISRNGGFRDDNLSTYGGESPEVLVLGPGDLYVSLKDVTQAGDLLGAVARVPSHVARGRITQDTVKLRFRSEVASRQIVYSTLLTNKYRDYCRSHATGTTNLGLSREDFLAFPIVQPNPSLQRVFDSVLDKLDARANSAREESLTLADLRNTLLPKLISGALRLKDAARMAGAVA